MCDTTATSTPTTANTVTPGITESSCTVQGDPHYNTFDKQAHDFMGTCTYTLSKLCDINSNLPYFNVEAANEHRSGNSYVSYVKHVNVNVYNHRITLEKGRVVKVDGQVEVLPVSVASGVHVGLSGKYVVVSTNFGLRVRFDGRHRAEVTLRSVFKGKVCGMCGNYNDDRTDDFLNPDGVMELDSVSLGNSWQTQNDTRCIPDIGIKPNCTDDEKHTIESKSHCGIIIDSGGPFKECHSVIDPKAYFGDCVYDLCVLDLQTGSLCSSLQSYADACQSKGVRVDAWRNETFCPLKCAVNSHYEQCGSACPATCVNPNAPSSCSQPCVEGCVCDSGYVFYNDRCVPRSQCGCWSGDKHYPVGSEFWTDDTCSTKCQCPSAGSKLVCRSSTCGTDSFCGVANGVPGCYPHAYGICRVHNDPHYNTFDKATHHFMGTCTYTIAKLCANSSSLPYFNIEAKNENRGNAKVSYVQRVGVSVHGHSVWIVRGESHRVLVDEVWTTLPVTLVGGAVSVSRSGRYVVLATDFGLGVSYDTDHSVEVKVPSRYFNQTCGMCGNYNGLREDDYMKPDGEQAKDSNELGNSWKVPPDDAGCDPGSLGECEPADEILYQSDDFCGLITSQQGPFVKCHSVINPSGTFESCVVELCLLAGSRDALCNVLQIYADACQSAGMTIPLWRNSTSCPVKCPKNSHYNACGSACPATCTDRFAPENCSKPCVEDCECNMDFVLSGSSCVPVEKCGCIYNNKYYEKGTVFWEEGCLQRCRCTGNDRVECEAASCGPEEICKVQDGNLGCHRADTANCHIYGDPHYTTFDSKLYHFQGACNYTVTETCGNTSVQFSVTSRNEHRGSPTWSAMNSVALRLDDLHVAVRKNKLVYVDGVRVELPVSPHSSVRVSLVGSFVVVQTDFGLQLKFNGDDELFVVVDERYKGQLCGLCGTYTDDQLDDFLKPDGILALDSNQFGNSWRVTDDDWLCNQTAPPPPTCEPSSNEEAEEHCKIILASNGPFKDCHWYIPPQLYFESCVYDYCATGGDSVLLCNALKSYASACDAAGVVLGDWREQSGCVDTSCALDCNFDVDLCNWTQSKTDNLDWKRRSGSTPSAHTGPSYDHTTAGGYYIYIEGNDGSEGDRAQLISAPCKKAGAQCLRFWYHMYGVARSMALKVYQVEGGIPVLMWSETGNKGNKWIAGEVGLHLSGNSQILIEAVRGNDYRSDVAVDDISFHTGCCGDMCDTTATSTPTTANTVTPGITESSCTVQGDPHYNTFDKQAHDFMGTCTYTLSKLCDINSNLPYFNVEAANEHRSGNSYVSYVKHVNVNVYNHRITLEKGRVVKVNGQVEVLPVSVASGVHVGLSGKYVVVSTNFGLRVRFDGRHRAEVTLRSVFKGKVCGMCGNYNDDRTDDFLNPDGVMELDSVSLGNSWQTQNDTRCIPDIGIKPNCTDDEKHTIESKSHCGIIIDSGGPFKECHSVIDPKAYFGDCVYDLCVLDLQTGSLCSSLQSYADACQSKGVRVDAWRNETFCPLKCAVNSHYEQCGSACPATCVNPNAPSSCSQPCVEGCVCDSGYVFYNDRCVPRSQCGCWSGDKHYPVGSEFWTDDTCSTKCQCPSAGSKLVCRSSTCGTDSFCGVANGVPGCYPHAYGICRVHNDPHYNTFDKATHHFMGTCTYTIAKLCANSSSLPYFNIEAKNENRGNAKVSYVQRVGVSVHGHSVWIVRGESHRVLVDEVWTTLPVTLVGGAVSVSRSGRYVVLATDFGLGVSYDTDHSVEVKVPSRYFNQTCGMCGNYNGLREDDYMKPDGEQAKDSNELGNSWKVPPDDAGCDPGSLGECEPADEILYQSDDFCGLITSQQGPFVKCHSVINPSGTFESCVVELCLLAGSRDALCNVLQIYADACQSAGMTIPLWRNSTSCPVKCPKNSHYNACGSACPATCTDRFAPENCSKPCVEDCECNMDFVLSGSSCVPVEKCGCIYNNKYYEKGTVFWEEGCLQRCRCTGNDRVECEAASCGPEEICKVQDGNLGCHRADTANCHIYGDPHYTTFDSKLYHFQGACNYTVTETCGNTSVQFSVTSRNEHRGSPTWSAMNSIALRLDDLHVAVRKNKLVYVDGVRVELPVSPHSSVRVSLVGSFVVVQTDFGLQLKFNGDDELFVVVDERYKGQLCGLCGTYTDDQLDDFLKPDGILALDSNQFGNSWRVTDDDWLCNQTAPPPPTCEPSSNEEAEEHCKIILASNGPFKDCHWYIPPQLYFESCVYDYCATGGDSVLLCNALKSYASACDAAGVVLGDWREQSGCVDTSCALDCNFDVDLCNWTQSKTDNLDWKRRSGSTPSAHTGPSYDHTTAGGYYIYIEGNDGSEGDRAQLISAPCKKAGAQCLRFWYHMYGVARSMALKVYQVEGGIPVLMWSETGNKGNKWIAGEVGLHLSGNSQILIEAVRGNDYRSDVAVDDISFHTGCCGDMCDTTATSTPTTANTVTPGITESSCTVQGDPHYNTFDKQAHDFMGTCTYTLSKLCDINSNLPYFNVEAANEHRSGNSYVSYVKHVNVNVYNHRITLEKGRVVKVDGQVEVLPVSVASGVHVGLSGKYVVVSTNFGLRVRFDGRHRAEVTLRSVFKGKVCGMCGNYNDDRTDDFLNPDGVMELDSVSLGNSWQTQNDTRCIPDIGIKPNCTDDEKHTIESKSHCGIIIDSGGPFKECHSVIDPKAYFGDCVYDLCVLDLQTGSLCSSLQSYADACQSKGVRVDAWRNETFCPLKCAVNSHYEQCGSACPATCVNPNAPSSCSQPCVEGCVCDSGYVFYNDRCVPRSQCGCWSGDKHYPVGSEFWTDDTCSTKCQCPSAGSKLVCRSSTCGTDSFCGVANGVPGCYPHAYGICRVHNDPHYNTFDKATHHFMGTCTYTIAKLCANSSSLPYFNIEAKNENRGNAKVSYVQRVGVSVHGHSVWIVRGESHRVLVDEVWTTLPVTLVGGAVSVSRSGRYVVLATDFGLGVSYDTDHSVEVKVPSRYFNQTCGMCGNYNGLREDDYMKPDGEQAKDSNELGNSWKVPPDDAGCDPGSLGECEPADEILYQSDDFCGLITSQQGPFVKCHSVINPSGTFESCVVELCLLAGSRDALCNVLQIYADACQSAGMTIPLWRNSTSCPVKCPKNSHYNACGSACPATCTDRFAPENCSKPCVEDCECNMDFVLSGSSCVPVEKCGCIYNNKYYEKGTVFWEEGCLQRCRCTGNDRVECEAASCGPEEICKVQDGNLGCHRADTANCHIYGDPHYTTFDSKLYHFQGACNYTVTETCGNTSVQFSVTSRNEHRGSPTWSAMNSVALRLDDLHVAVRKNKLVYVDGVRVELPVSPHSSVRVSLVGSFVVVQTDFGLQLKFNGDDELFVVVDERYKGQLCGLCGTYTDDQLDDFLKPDGILALDSNQFGNSWRVTDDDWLCNQTAPPPPTCEPSSNEEAEEHCKIILASNGPFKDCHWYIPPQLYFESCVYDYCATGGDSVLLCNALKSYASACDAAGVVLGDWREQSGCVDTSCALDCNFDVDLCNWTQSKTDNLDWKRRSGSTPSAHTGPSYDHTTAGGYYIYIEGNDGSEGDRAQLISAPCKKAGAQCLRFWYHMYGVARSMALKVYQVEGGIPVLMWSETGNKGNKWIAGEVGLHLSGNSQILIEAVRGNDYRSDVAVDDISFHTGCCGDMCDTTATSTPTTANTVTPGITESSCTVQGDPHYNTFDKQAHDFMGTCTYTLSKLCDINSNLPYFNVEAANEHRSGNSYVSYVKHVNVNVYNHRITLEKGRVVKVDGQVEVLPVSVASGVHVGLSGKYVVVSTNFGLRVRFDGRHRAEVTLRSVFKGKVCGMCGNYNDDRTDDFLNPDGVMELDSVSLGNSWQTQNDTRCIPDIGIKPNCTDDEKHTIESKSHCGIIIDSGGPFKECHSVIDPKAYFGDCVYDLCVLDLQTGSLCSSLQSYADACQSKGVRVDAWRNETFCPLKCAVNSHYEQCGSACPATCVNPNAPSSCSQPCVEGCVCDSGYVFYNDRCVPRSQCGCWSGDKHYPVGSEFWTDDTCSTKCQCPSAGSKLVCRSSTCGTDSFCGVANGVPGCYPHAYGICRVHNDPHYNTFDKATHHFMGTCTYTIAKLCANSSSLPYFNIEAKNENRGNAKVSYVQRVGVSVHGHSVWIVRGESHRVLVDEVWTTLPVTLVGGAVSVSRSGRYVVLATDFGLGVSYDTDHSVEVKVPSRYFNQTCGMCGNYNGLREDDYMKPDGEQAKDSNELGNSWKVPPDDAGCDPGSLGECEPADEILYQSDDFCGLITSQQGPFVKCHSVINPSGTFESCVVELCLLAGSRDALCNVLQIYADACQSAGMTIPLWRNSTSCPVKCPKNSHYNACGSACPATCTDRFAPENCSKPCVEDCECNMDFVLSGSSCVPVEKCGCIYNNKYYEKGTVFWDEGCLQRCRCTGNDRVECEAASCGPEEICKVQDGNLGCHRADTANCHIYGDPHYTTFDSKLYHFQGACNYTVTETCGNTSVQFSVTSRNEHRGSPTWSAMNSVALRLDDLHVAVRKNKLVYVDGVRVELPVSPHSSVRVSLVGSFVVVQTDFGLQLKFNGDDELFVVVDERYKGQLCGLCGTYTDDQLDDFLKPDGILALDSNQFGNSWRVTDDDWLCNQTAPPPPTCEPSSNEEAEEHCKIILASNGPFKDCHWYIPPQLYFESCVYDYCATGGDSVLLCNALKSYASACDAAGVVLGDWREQSGCVDTSCALDCNFDVDLCNWTQSKTDNLDWKRRSGSTPSAHTGPSYDHTTAGGYYIYIEGNDGSEGDRAQLISAPCKKAGAQCLRFWYHMYGVARSMALKVYQVEGGIPVLMWSETGNKGNKWIAGEVGLHLSGNSQILIEAVRGNDYRSDVAVDDISFHTGCCGDMCDTTATSTPTTANTVTPGITESSCTVQGDPHYNTFDKQAHDFMGTCTYTLSKLCDINSNLPYFNVEAANEHRSGNSYVSYVKHVNVNVYNHRITLEKGRVVKVDGQVEVLPVSVASGVHVGLSGKYVVVSTNFGLRVRFDGRHRAEVTLRSVFKGKVCGMCGNYNDDRTDDFLNPDGVMELDSVSLGNSWQTQNDTRCIPDIGIKPNCTDDEKHTIESKSHCGIIIDSGGPFKECHSVIDPKAYFGDCVYDLCVLDLQTGSLCSSLQSYADACQSKGVRVDAWRNETFCPLKCAVNSHYEQCGSACPATCVNPNAPSSCSQPCVEGCVCDSGYVFYNDRCVPRSQCGCWSGDKHYPVGSEFWTDDTCSTKCQCPSAGSKLVCRSSTCGTDSFCGVANGVPGCYPHAYGICRVHNDPHYNTFDKATHHFMGTCTYTIAKLCANSSSLPYFNIEAKNENRGNAKVSYVQRVGVSVHGHSVWIVRGESHRVLVDEVWTTLPVTLVGGAVSVSRSGRYVVLATDFGLGVSYDTDHSVEVKVPSRYFNQTCGMCGNYNGLREDDYMKPDGEQAKDSNELGNSWKVPPDDAGCDPGSLGECEPADEILYQSDDFCGLITSQQGPFVKCHSVINPSGTFESCVVELCLLAGSRDALCNVLQIYADACQSAGMTIPLWRNSTSCPVKCPKNSHYNACGSACPATCTDRFAPENCSKPCVEDCECNMDFVLSGSSCVPVEKCGCIYNNKYYEKGTVFWEEGCLQRCRCTGNDRVECEAASCGPEEICKVQDGNLGCHRADTANCHIYGDPHYTTFDSKLYHFQGACNYTVTETCGNTSVQFSVTSRNEHRGSPTWSAMNSVALRLDDLHVAVRKNKLVYVDGVRVELPVSPHSSVRVSLVGSFVVVQTDFGLQLKFNGDDELFVVVDERYKGQLCGLCGTYTDDQLDDFLKPDGILALDSNQFGNSWRVTDDDWLCNQTAPPPPTCEPSSNEEAEEHCKIILASNGPFKDCHWYIPPQLYFESCVYDYCATGGDSVLLCNALKSYASACDAAGVVLGDWREQSGCVDTSCALDCNFDVDLCNWTQSKTDNLDWKRRSGSTPSAHTGPSYDHTTAGGYYIYIEGNDGSEGDRAQLISAPCKKAGAQCLRFWYHMYGVARSMALKVYQVEGGIPVLMWSETGNKGNKWIAGEVGLHLSGNSQILIEAVRGNDYRSDVAVDDISFHTGCCGDMCDTTATSTPTTANTVTPGITESSCTVQGDPHYNTFDKQAHDFMGTCTYTLSKLCDINSNLPYFNVEAANEHRSGNSYVSYVKHVNVNVYNHRITLEKGRVVKVDGQVEVLPVSVASGVHVGLSGKYVVVSTNFGLRVRFDGRHRAEVTLRSVFKGKVCGMCGNYNDDRTDDFLNPDGVMELDSVSLGNSWQTQNDTRCIPDIGIKPNCTDDEKHTIESKSHCGIIIDSGGPFKECHSVIDPKAYFGDCVYDLCVLDLQTGSLCSSLQSYADACQSKGVRVDAWRNETFCPLKCAVNSHYEQCGSACPATCVNPNAPSSCSQPCVEGCVCDSGYVFYNDRCVPRSQCGCWSGDKHYPVGSEFWTDDTCSTKCQCPSAGSKLVCRSSTCGTDSFCGVANGVPGCYPHAYGICRVHNDPHYNTFDKATHHFMGTCTYTIAKLCANSSSLPYFNIEAKNENRGNAKVSYVQRVGVSVHGHSVWIVRGESHRVLVDEVWTTLPVTLVGGAVSVSRSGRYVVLATDFGLGVSYDTDHSVEVKVPSRYFNQTCGMCGNYNGLREDDYMKPDGEQAKDSNELGNSWKVPPDDAGCDPGSLGECEPADEILYQSDDFCGLITSQQGPFVKCHSVINPSGTFESCVVELCLLAGSRDALCNVLQIYADACQSAGMTIPLWRNSTSCPVKCPKNSHYNACGSACPATCTDRFAPENCSKPCVEDCECNMDFVLSGSSCVPVEKCGCIYNNKYYEVSCTSNKRDSVLGRGMSTAVPMHWE
ncbi:IgGFc-binding protein-like [Cetorhinus maximus]